MDIFGTLIIFVAVMRIEKRNGEMIPVGKRVIVQRYAGLREECIKIAREHAKCSANFAQYHYEFHVDPEVIEI